MTIHAKLTSINAYAFIACYDIRYINIPETVTFVGEWAFSMADYSGVISESPITIEFNEGRTKPIYIGSVGFSHRKHYTIIYPSNKEPTYSMDSQFSGVTSALICAHSDFNFLGKFNTTTEMTKCPPQIFKKAKRIMNTCDKKYKYNNSLAASQIIVLVIF